MGMKFKAGDKVAQVTNPIRGTIIDMVIVDKTPQYIVEWTAEDGDVHQRPFTEEQLEADAEAVEAAPDAPAA